MEDNKSIKFFFLNFLRSDNYTNSVFLIFLFVSTFFFFNKITTDLAFKVLTTNHKMFKSEMGNDAEFKDFFYDVHIYDIAEQLKLDRQIRGFNHGDDRHKLRWLYRTLEAKLFDFMFKYFPEKPLTLYTILNTIYCFFSLFFTFLSISILNKEFNQKNLVLTGFFYIFFFHLIFSNGLQSIYTIPEMLFVSIGIYFSVRKKFFLFLIPLFFGVINRESGIALSLVYIIFNYKNWYSYTLPICSVILLLIVNIDLVQNNQLYSLKTYFPIEESYSENKTPISSILFFLLFLLNFFTILFLIFQKRNMNLKFVELSLVSLLYFFVAILGTNFTNVFSLLLVLPSITILFISNFEKIEKK